MKRRSITWEEGDIKKVGGSDDQVTSRYYHHNKNVDQFHFCPAHGIRVLVMISAGIPGGLGVSMTKPGRRASDHICLANL